MHAEVLDTAESVALKARRSSPNKRGWQWTRADDLLLQ
jgi:hypothetical protein